MIDLTAFHAFSARIGRDPLQVQGPGGNTSIKDGDTLWIKASGTELADAATADIFVAVDRKAAMAEAQGLSGDGSCKATVLDPARGLRPSIETTFHAALDWPVVAHTHSIATLAHGVAVEGTAAAAIKLAGLPFAVVPYAKPGLPLTREIMACAQAQTRVFLLENHGLICCGTTVAETDALIRDVEHRLALPPAQPDLPAIGTPPVGHDWAPESWIARDDLATARALAGSYYPDHVVFLGPALPRGVPADPRPACLIPGHGVALRNDATSAQRAMLRCLSDLLALLRANWHPRPIGPEAEAALLDWDAEKYRQALAART